MEYFYFNNIDLNTFTNEIITNFINSNIDKISKFMNIQKERIVIENIINFKEKNTNKVFKKTLHKNKCYIFFGDLKFKKDENVCFVYNNEDIEIPVKKIKINLFIVTLIDKLYDCDNKYTLDLLNNKTVINDLKNDNFLSEKTSIQDNIYVLKKGVFISDTLCDELRSVLDSDELNIKKHTEKWDTNQNVNCTYVNFEDNNIIKDKYDNIIFNITHEILSFMNSRFNIICKGDSGYTIRKIFGPTRLHSDGISSNKKLEFIPVKKIRNLTMITCLNDDYEGSLFYFPNQNKIIRLDKGEIILFPPYWTHPHLVTSLLNNTYRYTLHTWFFE